MLSTIRMPQMGVSDESALLSKWLIREGDRVCKGQPVFSLETDKAMFQCEAESDGILVRILTGEGEEAAVGTPVGIMSDSEGDYRESELNALLSEMNRAEEKKQVPFEAETIQSEIREGKSVAPGFPAPEQTESAPGISPRAREKANELGVDWKTMQTGSGPEGRIIERDILNHVQKNRFFGGIRRKTSGIYPGRPLTSADRIDIRPVNAETAGRTGFVSRLVDARKTMAQCSASNRLTPGTVICFELTRLLARTPALNARRHGDRIYEYNTVHLRLAVETPVCILHPVIRGAETYTADELAVLMRNAAGRCRLFASKPQDFQEGTFSVADLSGYGTDCFTPELTPPELCSLGIGAVTMQTEPDERGGIETYPAIRLTLAYDGAGVDSLRAAKFLRELALRLETGGNKQ